MRTLRAEHRDARGLDLKPSPFTDCVGSICDREVVRRGMRGVRAVLHAATLHKPHVATHAGQDFVDVNVTGTLMLLEEAVTAGVDAFIFTSTTSAFGSALTPAPGEPAAWVTEDVVPVPRNIYGVTKVAAESMCELCNVQANEMLHRRVDIEDVVTAHLLALERAPAIGFARYVISATTPFTRDHLVELRRDAPGVVHRLFPDCQTIYAARQWRLFPHTDRVYVNHRARVELGWRPKYDFPHVLECLRAGEDFRSALAHQIGSKGYHATRFEEGPYPVA